MRIFLIITKSVVCSQVFFILSSLSQDTVGINLKKKFRLDG